MAPMFPVVVIVHAILGMVRGQSLHPMHYVFVSAAFFAFHLVFAYSADHLPVQAHLRLSAAPGADAGISTRTG